MNPLIFLVATWNYAILTGMTAGLLWRHRYTAFGSGTESDLKEKSELLGLIWPIVWIYFTVYFTVCVVWWIFSTPVIFVYRLTSGNKK